MAACSLQTTDELRRELSIALSLVKDDATAPPDAAALAKVARALLQRATELANEQSHRDIRDTRLNRQIMVQEADISRLRAELAAAHATGCSPSCLQQDCQEISATERKTILAGAISAHEKPIAAVVRLERCGKQHAGLVPWQLMRSCPCRTV